MEHFAEVLQHLDEATVLALRQIGVDDVVVEKIGARAGRDGEQLVAGAVHQNGAQGADFGGDVNWHAGKISGMRDAGPGGSGMRDAKRGGKGDVGALSDLGILTLHMFDLKSSQPVGFFHRLPPASLLPPPPSPIPHPASRFPLPASRFTL